MTVMVKIPESDRMLIPAKEPKTPVMARPPTMWFGAVKILIVDEILSLGVGVCLFAVGDFLLHCSKGSKTLVKINWLSHPFGFGIYIPHVKHYFDWPPASRG